MEADDQLTNDLEPINSLNEDQLKNLVNLVLNFLVNPINSDFQTGLGSYAEEFR